MNINWNNIRAINGQREGFEELVCQLAGQEIIDNQVRFIRVGNPDGGKECFWKLENGKTYCWQAKYHLNSLTSNQWQDLEQSVKTTIDNHPNLERYYVVIPVDRPDSRSSGKPMLQKWGEYTEKWIEYAASKGMDVSFEYWGKHELEVRLRNIKNEGLLYYFFNEAEFRDSWFTDKNQESINALGGRYTPELNFNLPFMNFHNAFTRDQKFIDQINGYYEKVLENYRKIQFKDRKKELEGKIIFLERGVHKFKEIYEKIIFEGIELVPLESMCRSLDQVDKIVREIESQYYEWLRDEDKEAEKKGKKPNNYSRNYQSELYELRELRGSTMVLNDFMGSEVCSLMNRPYLILLGRAGIGKSHALADLVTERTRLGKTSLILLGENFSTKEMPWTQILRNHLRFEKNETVLLGALNAKAETRQSRMLIIIDALNEGNGRHVWPKKLKSFIRSFEKYSWLGVIVSIRDSFEDLIAPHKDIDNTVVSRIYHPGFYGVEYEASVHFFKFYNIIPPGSPFLNPEFQNPLFLKLFCEGLQNKGLRHVPVGYQGISIIIESYLEGIELKLSQPDQLDYDIKLKLLRKAVDGILTKMVEEDKEHLHYETGEEIATKTFSQRCGSDDKQYLKRLISEGVINEDIYWDDRDHYYGIHFAYQRFQDHLIVSALLDKHLDENDPKKSFKSGVLRKLLENESEAGFNQNLIDALSVQVPERVNLELHEVAPYAANYYPVATAFVTGLMWRRRDTVGESLLKYVNQVLAKNKNLFMSFLEVNISMATVPDFHFNADRLHDILFKLTLSKRDSWWTTWLQNMYGENSGNNPAKRLIDWAWDESPKEEISDESARLASVMLGWFLTSSNRYLRDACTKALINLLQNRIPVLIKVLEKFEKVNDPYVYERLYAVAYGCALRTVHSESLATLSSYIYTTIFDSKKIYPHILLRDYARGVIEYAIYLGLNPDIKVNKIRPPYKSDILNQFPSNEEIDAKFKPKGKDGNHGGSEWGSTAILMSMTTEYGRGTARYGDFGRYVFQGALQNWEVDYDGLSNYAIQRIFELGYDPKIFTSFDSRQGTGREGGHLERIGKKYQWIVFYEILARVSDQFQLFDESSSSWDQPKQYRKYDGPWEPYVRDIDPTILIKSTSKEDHIEGIDNLPWWVPFKYQNWNDELEYWKRNSNDFPPILDLLTVTDSDGIEWVNLNMHPDWRELKKLGEDRYRSHRKRIWYDITTFLVESKDLKQMLKVDSSDNAWRNWSYNLSTRYEVFSGEYYWSPASELFEMKPYFGADALPEILKDPKSGKEVAKAIKTVVYYLWEEEFDCSKEKPISYIKPSSYLATGLKTSDREGEYINESHEVICFDPSVYETGPSCLLMRKDHLQKLLKKSGHSLVWIIPGEKQILGPSSENTPMLDHEICGLYYMDSTGEIKGETKSFIQEFGK